MKLGLLSLNVNSDGTLATFDTPRKVKALRDLCLTNCTARSVLPVTLGSYPFENPERNNQYERKHYFALQG
jgi:hypothetical protein